MSDFYDDISAEEFNEVVAHVKQAKKILQNTVKDINAILKYESDVANISNDTFFALVNMLRKLKTDGNYCIATMCEEAQQKEDE